MPVANKRIQYRTQLAFKPTNVDHMKVYQHLKNLPDKTDYIVRLVLADLSSGGAIANGEGASAFGGAPAKVEKEHYEALLEMLRPHLSSMVSEALRNAFSGVAGGIAAAPPPPPKEEEDLDLAMEGLKAFGV